MKFAKALLSASLSLSFSATTEAQVSKAGKVGKSEKHGPRCEPSSQYSDTIVAGNLGYCPGQADVDAWVNAQIEWGNTGYPAQLPDNPPPTYELWDNQNPDVLFCYNANCGVQVPGVTAMEEIVNRVGSLAQAYGTTYNFEVYDWVSSPGVLMVTDAIETLSDQCGVVFKLDFKAVYYYNNEGKVTAMQTLVFPQVGFETFLVNAFACLFSQNT